MSHPDQGRRAGRKVRVVKLGGSLLHQAETRFAIQRWLQDQDINNWSHVWVVGGGHWVELIRDFDRMHSLTAEQSHAASVAAMEVTARMVSGWFPEWNVFDSVQDAVSMIDRSSDHVCDGSNLAESHLIWYPLASLSSGDLDLPASWDVTSDSMAGWLAGQVDADELVLLKSCDGESGRPLDWIQSGLVDRWFSQVCNGKFSIRWVNLNDF